ncbi:DUF1045 domain-containing protein [Frigidibacter sp. ROC022]|uniref:DUF1045 domain-containing protein n=1 Tax=Frigidibacter sp. ROC022 TaxID=2971796 RepID=UPI00215B38FF|nr:DUF1045 domain-containing protein [Frigidibacter sp. ROC022]MCR8725029.1 DUF1045 domain-containing protein [Frigidibacter sp. ROC022]
MERYAIYYTPGPGALAEFAAAWLGWDPEAGVAPAHPDVPGLPAPVAELTETPRRYGFHGTLKAPFRLAEGCSREGLRDELLSLAARLAPVTLPGLRLQPLGGFLALVPEGTQDALAALAGTVVRALDGFRRPPDAAEIARRNPERLSPRQRANLDRWGYPYVFEDFRFHLTLTGNIGAEAVAATAAALEPVLAPLLPRPFRVGELSLCHQSEGQRFRVLERVPLGG